MCRYYLSGQNKWNKWCIFSYDFLKHDFNLKQTRMKNFKLGLILASAFFLYACGSPEQNEQTQADEMNDVQLINESDSLSNELSAASDSVEQKMVELETTLENLNN